MELNVISCPNVQFSETVWLEPLNQGDDPSSFCRKNSKELSKTWNAKNKRTHMHTNINIQKSSCKEKKIND